MNPSASLSRNLILRLARNNTRTKTAKVAATAAAAAATTTTTNYHQYGTLQATDSGRTIDSLSPNFRSKNNNNNNKQRNMSTPASSAAPARFPVTEAVREKLTKAFQPTHLDVINESYMHNVPKNSETHFKVIVVSSQFESIKSPLQRHRLINATLSKELEGPVHALSIVAKTPAQWESNSTVSPSPNCQGGDGSLPPKKS